MSVAEDDVDLRILSLGAGVQSTTLYVMAAKGELPHKPDFAIFADTQCEPPWVYENLDRLDRIWGDVIPIRRPTAGSLLRAVETGTNSTGGRFAAVPFWAKHPDGSRGATRRQCTREYKIDVVTKEIRSILGLKPGQRAKGVYQVEQWVGISLDEAHRAKPSRTPWIKTHWPLLLDQPMRRSQCRDYLLDLGYPEPQKSACTFCPYRPAVEYARWREEHPELFREACEVDDLIRSNFVMRGMKNQQFITSLLIPLRDLPPLKDLEKRDDAQIDLFGNECEGMCGV